MASSYSNLISFNSDGEFLAYCGADGRLRIVETATGILKQEYTPSSHLTAMCTCLAWTPKQKLQESPSKKRKKRKQNSIEYATESLNIIGMGTLPGKILLYSVGKGDLQSEMSDGHSDSVNCLCWNLENDEMFSCSHDGHIIQWRVSKGRVKSKWKADRRSVHSLVLLPDGQTLLSSGRTIKWWDIENQQVLKKFTGHASEVLQLRFLSFPDEPVEEGYFISAAAGDRLLSAWQLNRSERSALASFSLDDEPTGFDISAPLARDQKMVLAVVTKAGTLNIFEHQLNGKCRKPLEPKVTLQFAYESEKSPKPLPILSCQLRDDTSRNVLIAYGNFMKVVCEKLPYSSCESSMCLMRKSLMDVPVYDVDKQLKMKVMTPSVSSDAQVLAPGYMVPSNPTQSLDRPGGTKRKKTNDGAAHQLPMEERLSSLTLELPAKGAELPSSENLAHLLIQGLHSQDEQILDRVFEKMESTTVVKTVQRLPIEAVVPLLKELHHRLHGKWAASYSLLHWLRVVLTTHTSYLTTCSNLESILSPLYQLMDARVGLFQKMIHLKGRMDLIVTQLNSRKTSDAALSSSALLVYQDESSDEASSYIDDLLLSHSESEPDNWDEFSDEDDDEEDDDDDMEVQAGVKHDEGAEEDDDDDSVVELD